MTVLTSSDLRTASATLAREFLSYRVNRFLYLHVGLMFGIGLLALLSPPEAASPATAWWILNGVIYVVSLSALLLGLSSAQAEAEEFALLFTQPMRIGWWVAGKCAALGCVSIPAAALLVLPTVFTAGGSWVLVGAAVAAAAVSVLLSWLGLAIGFWIHDHVRGLITALAVWCLLLFGVDLFLIAIGGAEWIHEQPVPWVATLMLSPLDAYRITLLFLLERAAFSGGAMHPMTQWWLDHAKLWLGICLGVWSAGAVLAAIWAACRRRTC